mmetsp:Transcript_6230/g.13577  ORF Transcript_6230/g.13577 Transcript_6230/m.13577 type:complete len:258 (-) Transcript_6230:273-1046(-)
MGNCNTFRVASTSTSVHNDSTGGRLGRGGGKRFARARFDEIFKGYNLNTGRGGRKFNVGIGGNQVGGVNDCLEGPHILDAAGKDLDVGLVANDSTNDTIVDGLNDSINSKRGVNGCNNYRLGEGSQSGNHPLRTGVFKNGKRARSADFIEGALVRSRDEASRTEGGTKLAGVTPHLFKRPPLGITEVLHLGTALVLAEELTAAHALAVRVAGKGILGQIVQGAYSLPGGRNEVALVSGGNTMRGIIADWHRPLRFGR